MRPIDLALPATNRLGIPDLDLGLAPSGVPLPVRAWGETSRKSPNPGTWHHFVADYRFSAVEKNPIGLVQTGCAAAVECNYSVYDDTPPALAFAALYRKRYVARLWQQAGVLVFVDCNLPEWLLDRPEARYGIPEGYPAFATRGYERRPEALAREYEWATSISVRTPVFLVVGGGKGTAEWCRRTPGAFHSGYASTKRAYSAGVTGKGVIPALFGGPADGQGE